MGLPWMNRRYAAVFPKRIVIVTKVVKTGPEDKTDEREEKENRLVVTDAHPNRRVNGKRH